MAQVLAAKAMHSFKGRYIMAQALAKIRQGYAFLQW